MNRPAYMLDTNIVSDMVRNPQGVAVRQWARVGRQPLGVSTIVASELRFGCEKRQSLRLARAVEEFLAHVTVLPYDVPADHAYGRLRSALERRGTPIGSVDMFIAAHALALDVPLVTDNTREFSRVPGLRVENWLDA